MCHFCENSVDLFPKQPIIGNIFKEEEREINEGKYMDFKKFTKGSLAAVMALSLAACGSSDTTSSSSSSSDDTSAAASSDKVVLKLGASGPLSGGAAVYGQAVENAAKLAVAEVNELDGVGFEFKMEDDEHDTEKAVNAYGTLKDWGMQVALGTVTSAPMAAVAPSYAEDQIFALTPSASSLAAIYADSANATGAYGNVFQMCFTDPNQGVASADYISEHTDLGTKVAIIYKNDDNYSTGVYEKFTSEAEKVGLEIVYSGTFAGEDSDFSVQVQQAAAAGADLVYLPIYYQPASNILTEMNKQGYEATVFGIDGMDGILTMEGFDTSLAEGVYLLTPFSADAEDEKTQAFVKAYEEAYGETPNQFAADAYDCVYALKQAADAAGVTADMAVEDITAALVEQFTSMTFDGVTGTSVTWSETGEVSKSPKAVIIQNGVYVSAD